MHPSGGAAIPGGCPSSAGCYIDYYNQIRLHNALGFVTLKDKLERKEKGIFADRDRKLEADRLKRVSAKVKRRGENGKKDFEKGKGNKE